MDQFKPYDETINKNEIAQGYASLPWFRKSEINSLFVILGLFFPPFIWFVAYTLATGDIFYKKPDKDGKLRKWSSANKVVAWIIIAFQLFFWIIRPFFLV